MGTLPKKTHWEQQKSEKSFSLFFSLSLSPFLPPPQNQKGKKFGSIGHMLQFLIGSQEISIWNITYFGMGKWQGLEWVGGPTSLMQLVWVSYASTFSSLFWWDR